MIKRLLLYILAVSVTLLMSACSSTPPKTLTLSTLPPSLPGPRMDTFHTVGPGETLWRISKMYDVPLNDIVQANGLSDAEKLKMGERLTIPNAAQLKPVVTLYPSDKWKYIIIHHSATEDGSALQFHKSHLSKGWDKGVGYHFVIDRNLSNKQDGQIESTPRWIKQEDGAHCKAGEMNARGIGICLVGNFNTEKVTAKQLDSLVFLVEKLRRHYKIPLNHIMGHGEVTGASTQCPGNQFPWREFYRRLNASSQN